MDDPPDSFLEGPLAEMQEEADLEAAEAKLGIELGEMGIHQLLHCFGLHDHLVIDAWVISMWGWSSPSCSPQKRAIRPPPRMTRAGDGPCSSPFFSQRSSARSPRLRVELVVACADALVTGRSEPKPKDDAGDGDLGRAVAGRFIVPGGQAAELLEPGKSVFDGMASLVKEGIIGRWLLPARMRRNDCLCPHLGHRLPDGGPIVGSIAQDTLGLPSTQQRLSRLAFVGLPRRDQEIQWVTMGITEQMNFSRDPATGASERLLQEPPF